MAGYTLARRRRTADHPTLRRAWLQNVWLERSLRTKLVGRYVITFTIRADVRAPGATS